MRRIQKTIQVTKPTATIEAKPPNRSCASKLMLALVNCRTAPKARLTTIAAATPVQSGRRVSRRPVLTR